MEFVLNSKGIQLSVVNTRTPTTIFFLYKKYRGCIRALARSDDGLLKHVLNHLFNFFFLFGWITVSPYVYWFKVGFKCDGVVKGSVRRKGVGFHKQILVFNH